MSGEDEGRERRIVTAALFPVAGVALGLTPALVYLAAGGGLPEVLYFLFLARHRARRHPP